MNGMTVNFILIEIIGIRACTDETYLLKNGARMKSEHESGVTTYIKNEIIYMERMKDL